ncbi:hybrid sensor histidine kinase/response regulator [Confluentibacter flavum]|uniref:histidine kinase n=1 Tax=Confluentibacter flavum TaxID=1909700 RepID=A0A2N3HNR4_9FLAO|nr:hybrid sensor histidine kinase/response regulator transcription factor [Confluentibacter flavum]PKQ46623.1 hybrid sensor histidine kinase/response regulator [Confluentibacter flavum]
MKTNKTLLYFTIVFWIITLQNTIGQSSYIFRHLNTNDGLSNASVKAILRDSYGFLWVGTESGLNRYDGYGFKVYNANSKMPHSLESNDVMGLQEDGLGNIWVDLGFTYMVYNREKDHFISEKESFFKELNIQAVDNSKIYVDKKQNLWVLNREKVFCYNIKKKTTSGFNLEIPLDDIGNVNITDNGDSLFVISQSGEFWQLNVNSGKQTIIKLPNFIMQAINKYFNKIYVDSNNGLWLHSNMADVVFYRKHPNSEWMTIELKSEIQTDGNSITSIIENRPGQIWIVTDHKGVFVYNKAKGSIENIISDPWESSTLSSNSIKCIYRDSNETVWIGHSKKGLSYYHESFRNIMNFEHPECSDISVIMEDHLENIWLGTDGNGLFVKDKKLGNGVIKLPIPNVAIVSILEDRANRIWIGTFQKGLYCYENGKMVQYTTGNSKLSNNNIWDIEEDRYGNIWIGTLGGKIQLLPSESSNFDFLLSPFEEDTAVLDMFYDGGDKVYAGTVSGLLEIDITTKKHVIYFSNINGTQRFLRDAVTNVYKDNRDILWLGHNIGLTIWDKKTDKIYYFNKAKGLCDDSIKGIVSDNLNNIWVTTSNGLSILTADRDLDNNLSITSKNYSVKDGLMDNFFNAHSISKLKNGDILLGNIDGYSIFNPNKMEEKNRPLAKVKFTGLTVSNQKIQVDSIYNGHKLLERPMELTSDLIFKYNDKLISLQFTTGDLLNADKIRYAYQIEGFNTEWIPTQENKIELSTLHPGEYKLLIKASNSDGVWNNDPTILNIKVTPPFYFSIWAIVLYALATIGIIIYFILRSKRRHLIKLEQHRIRMDREKEMQVNEMKLKFFTNISHDLRTPLTLIITPLQVLLNETMEENMKKKLSTIYKNAQQLLSLINSLLDFRKLDVGIDTLNLKPGDFVDFVRDIYLSFSVYANERHINLSLSNEIDNLLMQFDRDKIQKTLTNLLSNAFKYTSDGGAINIHIDSYDDYVYVSVSDSGPGISDEDKEHVFERFYQAQQKQDKTGSGIGLHIANEYVNLHGGAITLTDNIPYGCVFTIKLPIREISQTENLYSYNTSDEDVLEDVVKLDAINNKPLLLFVDDNKDFCGFMVDNLEDEYSVITANNGLEAIEQLNKQDVTIVISDVMMPIMSGTELCEKIKTNIYWSHIPVILLTARAAEEHQIEGLELGADDYITKPFNFNLLRLRIRKFIEWTERSHNIFSQKLDVAPSEITITSLDEKLIEKAIKVVEDHISNSEFSVETLGMAVGLSRGHLYKKLMVITGKGPSEFIRTIRLKRGRQLLEKSQLQISEIAYEVGFNSPKRFTKYFRDEFGVLPSEYLRIHKE